MMAGMCMARDRPRRWDSRPFRDGGARPRKLAQFLRSCRHAYADW